MSIYFKDTSINKVRKDALGAIETVYWGRYFGRTIPTWLNINLIKRR